MPGFVNLVACSFATHIRLSVCHSVYSGDERSRLGHLRRDPLHERSRYEAKERREGEGERRRREEKGGKRKGERGGGHWPKQGE